MDERYDPTKEDLTRGAGLARVLREAADRYERNQPVNVPALLRRSADALEGLDVE